jgi:hypothetical protein
MDLKDKKNIIILSVSIGLLLLGGWFLFFRDSGVANDSLSETSINPIENIIGQELLVSLGKMKVRSSPNSMETGGYLRQSPATALPSGSSLKN